jgi:glycosyltransferase involved in cell wall biosynthesis
MCRRWVEKGHQVTVVTTPYDKSDIPRKKELVYRLNYDGIEVIVINFPQSNKNPVLKRIWDFMKYIVVALYYGFRLPYDVAVCSSGPITVGVVGIICCSLRNKLFVFEVRDLWPAGAIQLGIIKSKWLIRLSYWFEKKCYKRADLIVAASQGMRSDIQHRFGLEKIIVVPNACDIVLFQQATPVSLPAGLINKQIVLYTGSLGKMDHCIEIMEAARLLDRNAYPDIRLVIIGEGVDREMMEQFKLNHQLDHVLFTGLVPKTEVAGWYKHAVASIITISNTPMLHTISPNKMFDSLAAGVPIIQTTQGWIKQMVAEEHCGVTVMPDSPAQMAAAIQRYVHDKELRNRHAANALRVARTKFSRDHCADVMLQGIVRLPIRSSRWRSNRTASSLPANHGRTATSIKMLIITDWYTPSSHASSLRLKPWIDKLRNTQQFDIKIFTDKVSKGEKGVVPNLFRSPDNRTRFVIRFVQEMLLGTEIFFRTFFNRRRLVVITSPPFIISCFATLACYLSRKKYVFDVRDVYPLVYANSGFFSKKSIVFRCLDAAANRCYRNALFTTTVTPQLVSYLQSKTGLTNIHLVRNGFNNRLFIPSHKKFEKFTLVFHGNIGQFQNPGLLVRLVEALNELGEDFNCMVIGSGNKQKVFNNRIKNLEFHGRLGNDELAKLIRKAHVGISFRTDDEISARSIPVRVSEYIGIGIPCVLTPQSEGGELLEQMQVGKAFANSDTAGIVQFILQLKYDQALYNFYSQNALKVRKSFSREKGAEQFVDILFHYLELKKIIVSPKNRSPRYLTAGLNK